jgi:hypothetical protein
MTANQVDRFIVLISRLVINEIRGSRAADESDVQHYDQIEVELKHEFHALLVEPLCSVCVSEGKEIPVIPGTEFCLMHGPVGPDTGTPNGPPNKPSRNELERTEVEEYADPYLFTINLTMDIIGTDRYNTALMLTNHLSALVKVLVQSWVNVQAANIHDAYDVRVEVKPNWKE